jgi:hypothetical protein
MTTILTDKRLAHIGRRSELAPDDGMTLRRRLIRSDEDLARRAPHSSRRSTSATWSEPMTTPPGRDELFDTAQPGSAPRRVPM